jgi:hypothetical protein
MGDFFKSHFDKLLLTGLLLTLFFATIHTLHHGTDTAAINWLENTVGQVLAALLTLMVGQRLTQRSADSGNGVAPVATSPTPQSAAAVTATTTAKTFAGAPPAGTAIGFVGDRGEHGNLGTNNLRR